MYRSLLPFLALAPATVYALLTLWCGRSFFKSRTVEAADRTASAEPAITILKPVKGMDEGSYDNFASFCSQQYSGQIQLIFCVAHADDPVIPVIHKLIDDFPHHDISLQIDATIHGPNYKISNLINSFDLARHDLLMICDSDIRVPETFIRSVTAHFCNPTVGLVTSPYRSSQVHGPATAFEALAFSAEMIPNVVTAIRLEGLSFALGAAMTFRREALQQIGGLQALVEYLADDYQLGNKIHRAGWQLVLDRQFVESMLKPEDFRSIFTRQLRWSRTMRVSRPGGYLASGITLPGMGVIAALLLGPLPAAFTAITAFYLLRLYITTIFSRSYLADNLLPRWAWLLPLRDLLACATWLGAFTGNSVIWRGHRFLIRADGKLKEL